MKEQIKTKKKTHDTPIGPVTFTYLDSSIMDNPNKRYEGNGKPPTRRGMTRKEQYEHFKKQNKVDPFKCLQSEDSDGA